MDKTGTLTEGRPAVTGIVPASGFTEDEARRLAAGVERASEHPLALAAGPGHGAVLGQGDPERRAAADCGSLTPARHVAAPPSPPVDTPDLTER
ncbi:hypothetical protein [Paracoccus sp. S-4012]|uniref:hypothetical protein n=1 Tax=Paracoccus sp. S-4012 TaxID=2665648 RepID=UPI00351B4B1F